MCREAGGGVKAAEKEEGGEKASQSAMLMGTVQRAHNVSLGLTQKRVCFKG